MHAIEHLGLVVQDALRRVEVLGDFFVRRQRSPAKPNDPARHIPDREHDTAFEEIPQRAVVPLFAQSGLHEFFGRVARLLRRCGHGVPRVRTVPNHERVEHVVAKPPFHEVAPSNGLSSVGVPHLVHEPLGRPGHEVGQAFLGGGGRQLLRCGRLFLHLDVVALRKNPQRLWVTGLFQFHQKRHHVPALAAGKTLENAFGWKDVKRRGFFVRERAQSAQRTARFFQLHMVPHHVFNDGGVHDLIDGFLRNHGV